MFGLCIVPDREVSCIYAVHPHRVNYIAPYSLCKRIGSTFANDIIRPVDIGIDGPPARGLAETALALPAERRLILSFRIIGRQGVEIEKAGFTGIALFGHDHLHTHRFGLVSQQLDEAGMRDLHEVLAIAPPQLDLLIQPSFLPMMRRLAVCSSCWMRRLRLVVSRPCSLT